MISAKIIAPATGNHPGFARTPSPFNATIIHSGNSLTDAVFSGSFPGGINSMVNAIAGSSVAANEKSTIVGSSMAFRWVNATAAPDAKTQIANYQVFVLTDVSGNFNTNSYGPTVDQLPADALLWVDLAWTSGNAGAGSEVLLWAPWARTDIPDIDAQYQTRFTLWAQIQDYCNATRPINRKPVRLIPGAWLWYEFWKDQQAGLCPTPTWYDDLYSDEVHQLGLGNYIAQVLHVCCLYGVDPLSTPSSVAGLTPAPTSGDLAYIRAKIKQVVSAVKRSGVDTSAWT